MADTLRASCDAMEHKIFEGGENTRRDGGRCTGDGGRPGEGLGIVAEATEFGVRIGVKISVRLGVGFANVRFCDVGLVSVEGERAEVIEHVFLFGIVLVEGGATGRCGEGNIGIWEI